MIEKIKNIFKKTPFYNPIRKAYYKYYAEKRRKKIHLKTLIKNRKEVMDNYGEPFYLNIGSRFFVGKNWKLLDYSSTKNGYDEEDIFPPDLLDYNFDLTTCPKLPIKNNSVDLIYSSHCFEHIGDKAAINIIKESYRILKNDGIFRIVVPDIDIAYEAYKKNDIGWFKENMQKKPESPIEDYLFGFAFSGLEDKVDMKKMRMDIKSMTKKNFLSKYDINIDDFSEHDFSTHITWFNKDKIIKILNDCGFSKIKISSPHQSISSEMRSSDFDPNESMSLYIDAVK